MVKFAILIAYFTNLTSTNSPEIQQASSTMHMGSTCEKQFLYLVYILRKLPDKLFRQVNNKPRPKPRYSHR